MKPGLVLGTACELRIRVTPELCPHFDGVLVHPVYATWSAVHHMEVAGRKLLVPYLEDHEEAVGAHLTIDHRSPAVLDSSVIVRAEATHCKPHRLDCCVSARVGQRLIADGVFVQIIMPKARLASLIERHPPE